MPDTKDAKAVDLRPTPESAAAYILAHSTVGENGKRTSTKADYLDFMKENGIPKSQVQAVSDSNSAYVGGAVHVATDDLVALIKKEKKAGNDPSDLRSEVVLPIGDARIHATVTAHQTARSPRTGEQIERYGSVKVGISIGTPVKRPAAERARADVTAAMGKK